MTDFSRPNLRERAARFTDSRAFQNFILFVILFNAGILGLETSDTVMQRVGPLILLLDRICLVIFVVEIGLKFFGRGLGFFRRGWSVFDFVIVAISLIPAAQGLSVLRALRILRLLRVVSMAPSLRRVVEGLFKAIPGMASVFVLMAVIFYIGSVMATKLFGDSFPEWFGTLAQSGYTLFQIMTLESWSMGIVRPVMEQYQQAWLFFVPFRTPAASASTAPDACCASAASPSSRLLATSPPSCFAASARSASTVTHSGPRSVPSA